MLTSQSFWDRYWANCPIPSYPDELVPTERAMMGAFRRHLPAGPLHVLEIGCAPGRWLAFFARELGWVPPYTLRQGLRATGEWYRDVHGRN